MIWYAAAVILVVIALVLLVLQFVADRRYLKKKPAEAMSRRMWNEIQEEREASKERHEKFQAALDQVEGKEKPHSAG